MQQKVRSGKHSPHLAICQLMEQKPKEDINADGGCCIVHVDGGCCIVHVDGGLLHSTC